MQDSNTLFTWVSQGDNSASIMQDSPVLCYPAVQFPRAALILPRIFAPPGLQRTAWIRAY